LVTIQEGYRGVELATYAYWPDGTLGDVVAVVVFVWIGGMIAWRILRKRR
jgi:hypothetical protein